jgi:photosystem II stability/assembly factor-like uncharacterized protein
LLAHLYVATNGLSVWSCEELGDKISRMPSTCGMYSGSHVWALAVHPATGELHAGTDSGLYRLNRSSDRWTHMPSPMDSMLVTAIAFAPDDPRLILAGTQPASLFRSEDGGKSWRKLDVPMKPYATSGFYAGEKAGGGTAAEGDVKHWMRVTQILFHSGSPDTVWSGVEIDGAWRSRDRGKTWQRISEGLDTQDIHGMALANHGIDKLFMVSPSGIYVSQDQGTTWALKKLDSKWQYTRTIVERPDRTGVMFVTNGNGPPGSAGRLFRSRNHGVDWEDAGLPEPVESSAYFIAVNEANPMLIFVAANLGQIYRSMDGGESWTALKRRLPEVRAIAWLPD